MPEASRRGFLRGAAGLGALTFLTGCDIIDGDTAEGVLRKISEFNDGAQAALFSRTKLAPTYSESAITRPFPFNGYYDEDEAPVVDGNSYRLEVAGLVDNKKPWTLEELHALPEVSQITRHDRMGNERPTIAQYPRWTCALGLSRLAGLRVAKMADAHSHPR